MIYSMEMTVRLIVMTLNYYIVVAYIELQIAIVFQTPNTARAQNITATYRPDSYLASLCVINFGAWNGMSSEFQGLYISNGMFRIVQNQSTYVHHHASNLAGLVNPNILVTKQIYTLQWKLCTGMDWKDTVRTFLKDLRAWNIYSHLEAKWHISINIDR